MKENKGLTIVYIIILILIVIILLTALILGISGKFPIGKHTSLTFSDSYTDINNIKVKSYSYDVDVLTNTDNTFKVEVYDYKNKVSVVNKDGGLEINQEKGNVCFGICGGDTRIVLYVPDTFENLEITTSSGDITMLHHNTSKDINTTSGDIELLSVTDNKVKSTSGEINIIKATNSTLKSTSGDIELKDGNENVWAETTSGDIEISRIKGIASINSTSGDIEIENLEITDNSKIEASSGDITVDHFGEGLIDAQSNSGDKDIKTYTGIYTLYVKTTSGDISIR